MQDRKLIVALALLGAPVAACIAETPAPSALSGAGVAIEVAPLELAGITAADYVVTVRNSVPEVVWTRALSSGAYGDGSGSLSYVGTCDADASPNTVELELVSLSDANGPLTAGVDYANPAPSGDAISLTVDCVADRDTPVVFDLTVARAATQGFFDVAVTFSDIFCSAKLDCESAPGVPLKLLTDPLTGQRDVTAVLGFACTAGPGQDTFLYMDPVTIACNGVAPVTVDPSAGVGNLDPAYSGANTEILFQAAVFRSYEQLPSVTKGYWNVALGLHEGAFGTLGPCTISADATATDGPLIAGQTPDGVRYPVVHWGRELVDSGGSLACTHHAVNDGTGVEVVYTPTTGHTFAAGWSAAPTSPPLAASTLQSATGSVEIVAGTIALGYTPVAGATSYTGTCTASGLPDGVATAAAPATSLTVTGLDPGTTYTCAVYADDGAQTSPDSNTLDATPTSTQPEFSSPYATTEAGYYSGFQYPGSRDGIFYALGTAGGTQAWVNPSGPVATDVVINVSDPLRTDISSMPYMATDRDDYAGRLNDDDPNGLVVTIIFQDGVLVSPDAYWLKGANFGAGTTLQGFDGGSWETLRTWSSTWLNNTWGESWGMLAPSGPLSALRFDIQPTAGGWHNLAELELFGPEPAAPTGSTLHPGELWVSADDACSVYVDGVYLADCNGGHSVSDKMVLTLPSGANVVAVRVRNGSTGANPTAFIAQLSADGVVLDRTGTAGSSWKMSPTTYTGWELPSFDDSGWGAPVNCSGDPWGGTPTDLRATGASFVGDTSACSRAAGAYTYYRYQVTTN